MDCFNNMFKCCRHDSLDNLSMASVTYGLRRFIKNAMLIICQATSQMGGKSQDRALKDLESIKDTFQKYLFEAETYIDLTSNEIEDVCRKFFSRDFSDYGAIAVVILAQNGGPGTFMARDQMYDEDIIINYFKYDKTGSLSQKPKVYITEANRVGPTDTNVQYSVPLDDVYRHVIGFHIPLITVEASRSPLQIFCDRMSNPRHEDYFTLIRIIDGAVREIEETFPSLQGKIEKTCTTIAAITLPVVTVELLCSGVYFWSGEKKEMRNWFTNCCAKGSLSRDEDTPYCVESNGSVDNISMISVTYGLESFNKNAMLVFCQVISKQGNRNRDLAMDQVAVLRDTFQKYRFEVEICVDLSCSEIEEKCDNFFARDFSEYGAVAVVILAPDGQPGVLAASDGTFNENVVLKHFTTHVPMTLRGKPKIYITEANRQSHQDDEETKTDEGIKLHRTGSPNRVSTHIDDFHEDILGLHIPSVVEDEFRSPLRIFCNRMNASEDHGNMIGIIIGSMEEIEDTFPVLENKLELICTFKKRFTLPMFVLLE